LIWSETEFFTSYKISNIVFIHSSIFSRIGFETIETNEIKYDLSTVSICEKFTTDVEGSFETAFSRSKFAGEPE
jgi:hypothetical protein